MFKIAYNMKPVENENTNGEFNYFDDLGTWDNELEEGYSLFKVKLGELNEIWQHNIKNLTNNIDTIEEIDYIQAETII